MKDQPADPPALTLERIEEWIAEKERAGWTREHFAQRLGEILGIPDIEISTKDRRATAAAIRRKLVHTLGLDLVGPDRDSELLEEPLPQSPSRWYLTGFLVPADAD